MGGVVAPIVKPVAKLTDKLVGTDLSGKKAQAQVQQAQAKVAEMQAEKSAETPMSKASRAEEESGARMRGARRRGRQLLSDARLNAETGVQTLGSSQNL
jgi:hypothetical protein